MELLASIASVCRSRLGLLLFPQQQIGAESVVLGFELLDPILPLTDFESDCAEFAWMVAIGRLR
jgi:hypothetical protein